MFCLVSFISLRYPFFNYVQVIHVTNKYSVVFQKFLRKKIFLEIVLDQFHLKYIEEERLAI